MNRLPKNHNGSSLTGLEGPEWEFRRSFASSKNIMMEVSEEAHQSSNIRYLYLHSTQVLLPPHFPWTLSMIKISPNLTSVSFACISLNSSIWGALLPLIAEAVSHQLVELAFSGTCKGLTSRHIIQFLERLNCLEHLKLDQLCDAMISTRCPIGEKNHKACPYPKPHLPHLRVLTAPVKFSNHIIRSQSSLSRIRRWDTFYFDADLSSSPNPALNLDVILHGLSNMLKKEPRTEPLEISMMMGKFRTNWISFENVINRARHDSNSIIPIRDAILLDVTGFLFESKSLALWLGKSFPNAAQLTTSQKFMPQRDRDELGRGVIPKTVRELIASISATCPSMRKLVLGSWMVDFSKGVENSEVSPVPKSVYTL
ncbi:hypothetical protein BDZ97DRAFT_1915957 [Flammula alnicola]|nr:hypothetical protein BDZ97DRAFT_1915957 [Flammula alnicola]